MRRAQARQSYIFSYVVILLRVYWRKPKYYESAKKKVKGTPYKGTLSLSALNAVNLRPGPPRQCPQKAAAGRTRRGHVRRRVIDDAPGEKMRDDPAPPGTHPGCLSYIDSPY
ncbi:hypothetical protein EVAR_77201_1 [Eumeta japonica]|uniref:Uncharacterized protein n=1 Tax=Eumeta variegata TaxID=151549 RepID=A0A4C1T281_EUMVA|nr:hypothetical protein EVAR_77201_1 [Eumeta japonica]